MKIENQVTSLELSKKLKKLGVKQNSLFYWFSLNKKDWVIVDEKAQDEGYQLEDKSISAFTAEELINKLPMDALTINGEYGFYVIYSYLYNTQNQNGTLTEIKDKRFSNALAKLLIYLLENKFTIK